MPEYNEIDFNGLLSKEDFFKLIEAVRRDGKIDETEAERLVNWAMQQLTKAEMVRLMISGFLTVSGWDGDEPNLEPTMDAIVAMDATDAEKLSAITTISI